MKNLFYALTFFSFVTACSDNSVQNPTPPPVSDNGDNNNMQVVEFLRNRAMVASYNTIFPNKETERIERKGVLLSWRWLSTDPDDIGFDIYRKEGNYKFQKLNKTPIINSSNYKDLTANINKILKYHDNGCKHLFRQMQRIQNSWYIACARRRCGLLHQ